MHEGEWAPGVIPEGAHGRDNGGGTRLIPDGGVGVIPLGARVTPNTALRSALYRPCTGNPT